VFICGSKKVELKIRDINLSEGWVHGIRTVELLNNQKSVMAGPVVIHYPIGDNWWKLIQVNHCYKILP